MGSFFEYHGPARDKRHLPSRDTGALNLPKGTSGSNTPTLAFRKSEQEGVLPLESGQAGLDHAPDSAKPVAQRSVQCQVTRRLSAFDTKVLQQVVLTMLGSASPG